ATKICDPYILKLNIDIGGGPMLYITFSARDIVDDNAAGDAAEPKVYRAKVLTIFPVHKSVVFFCRFKGLFTSHLPSYSSAPMLPR
ncbi:hypothetical protein CRG98_049664, partial [Punica granatum]